MKIKLLGLILLFGPSVYAEDVLKLPEGQTLVAVGGSWDDSFQDYAKTTGHLPQGVNFWGWFRGR